MSPSNIFVSTTGLHGLPTEVTRFERIGKGLVAVTVAVESTAAPPVRLGDLIEVTNRRDDGDHCVSGVAEGSTWKPPRHGGAGELVLRVRVQRRFRRVKRAVQKAAKRRGPDRRRRVTVPDKMVTGRVSATDVVTYLLATGWRHAYEPTFYERVVRGEKQTVQAPFDDPRVDELEDIICEIAACEGRPPGDVLRSVEALARAEGRRPRRTAGHARR